MFRILLPQDFVTSLWKNGGGLTHEIARDEANGVWRWRLSVAEVTSDGPFSRFEGLSRILTVIEGNGIDLHAAGDVIEARALRPVRFSGDIPVESRMVDGPIRDLNVIHDARLVDAGVEVISGPRVLVAAPSLTGLFCIAGNVTVDGQSLPVGAIALGDGGEISLGADATGLFISLRSLQ